MTAETLTIPVQTYTAGLGIRVDSSNVITNVGIRSAQVNGNSQITGSLLFIDFMTNYTGTQLQVYGPTSGTSIAISTADRVVSNAAPTPSITVSGSTLAPSQVSSVAWGGALGSLSGSVLTMTPAAQDTAPDILVGGTTYTSSQVDTASWSGVSGSLAGTTLSLTADHYMHSAGYGMSLTGSVFAATRSAPVLTISGVSYSPTVVNQITWNNLTASISGYHLSVTVPSGRGGTIAPRATTQGAFNVGGALHVTGDITSTCDVGCNGVLATQLTIINVGSSIPGYLPTNKYAETTDAQAFTSTTGTWLPWNYKCSIENHIGNGHSLHSTTSGVNTVASDTITYLKNK